MDPLRENLNNLMNRYTSILNPGRITYLLIVLSDLSTTY